ncbi:MAG: hypothetical protein WCW29_04660 [Candidatus Paceibacterota bacterium]|jgi:hypothetical protein
MTTSNRHKILKEQAISLRLTGQSYREISTGLKVSKSTLSGWLKNIEITSVQKHKLHQRWIVGLAKARSKAGERNKQARLNRIQEGKIAAKKLLESMPLNAAELELFLAGLYLGEGFKIKNRFGLGNANPAIVLLFVTILRKLYPIKEERLRAAIFGRADQDSDKLISYWSNILNIPTNQFHKTQLDQRTKSKTTHTNYFGVCAVSYNDSSLQRRILAISDEMVKYINT